MKTVLFACVHNAGRSQMAAAWFNALADATKARGTSAGTEPGARVHPEVLEAMREVGIDLAGRVPQRLTESLSRGAAMLVTMGCGEQCPVMPGLRREDWPLEDPKGKSIERVREIRDDVRARVASLLRREGWARTTIRGAKAEDREQVEALLRLAGLPLDGVSDHLGSFFVAEEGARIVAAAGLESYGAEALLRSVVVDPSSRGTGLGAALTRRALEEAHDRRVREIYLLTTTAERYFPRFGFETVTRSEVPAAVQRSREFQGGCPASAVAMRFRLA